MAWFLDSFLLVSLLNPIIRIQLKTDFYLKTFVCPSCHFIAPTGLTEATKPEKKERLIYKKYTFFEKVS
jgi:surface polysaccharide O-acyltransferase-like enzyme